jgi:hypothetical protein
MDALLTHFPEGEVAVGGSFDGPVRESLGEFIQQKLKTKMNPAVYVAALLIDEGYADASRRGYIRFRSRKEATGGDRRAGVYNIRNEGGQVVSGVVGEIQVTYSTI